MSNDKTMEMFEAFIKSANVDWDGGDATAYTRDGDDWFVLDLGMKDPYMLLPMCIKRSPKGKTSETMLLMYGWATPLDDDGEVDESSERVRVRILVHFTDGSEAIAYQVKGDELAIADDDEGMFGDTIKNLRMLQTSGLLL